MYNDFKSLSYKDVSFLSLFYFSKYILFNGFPDKIFNKIYHNRRKFPREEILPVMLLTIAVHSVS